LGIVGGNIKNFPVGSATLSALGFQISLGVTIAVIVYGWFFWNTFKILGYTTLVSVATVFFGRSALSNIARTKK
jgi:hypothetical protein